MTQNPKKNTQFQFRCTPEEKVLWAKVAGETPVAEWVRTTLNNAAQGVDRTLVQVIDNNSVKPPIPVAKAKVRVW